MKQSFTPINEDYEQRSRALLKLCFGSLKPALAYLPHCLFKMGTEALAAVLNALDAKGGVFGDHPRWNRDEHPYIGFEQEGFALWELPKNQEVVLAYGAHPKLDQFTAVIDARSPAELLREMYSAAESADVGFSWYDWWIENIARWLPKLGWAYIPLTEHSPFAMFVARKSDKALVDAVKSQLAAKGIHSFELSVHGDTVTWPRGEYDDINVDNLLEVPSSVNVEKGQRGGEPHPLAPDEEQIVSELREREGVIAAWDADSWYFDVETEADLLRVCERVQPVSRKLRLAMNGIVPSVSNEGLERMPTLSQLVEITVGPPVSAEGLLHLARQPNLRRIETAFIPFSDADLAKLEYFAVFPRLEELQIDFVDLKDNAVARLKSLVTLKKLTIAGESLKG